MNTETVAAMKTGAEALTKVTQQTNIEDIDDMNEEIAEAMDAQAEINEALQTEIGMDGIDEDDLSEELRMLEELDAEEEFEDLPDIAVPANTNANTNATTILDDMPTAPKNTVITEEQADEDELASLLLTA